MNPDDTRALVDLSFHWDSAYSIAFSGDVWSARPHAEPTVLLTAASAGELRALMRADYLGRKEDGSVSGLSERMST
jgi:hypothetical protein